MEKIKKRMAEFLKLKNLAVVGATDNKGKWGYRIFMRLQKEGYNTIPIHPKLESLEGKKCYPSLLDIEETVEGVDIVVPPAATKKVLEECVQKGIQYAWIQPGAETDEAIEYGESQGLELIYRECVLATLDGRSH